MRYGRGVRDVGYARISKDDLLLGRGVGRQEQDVRTTSERTGGTLVEMLVDNDTSASRYSKKRRVGYQRLLELVRAGVAERVIAYDLDRLLRQPRELEDLIDLVEERPGFAVVNLAGSLDLTSGDGRFIARVLVAKAAKESDDTSRRLKRSNDQYAAEGRPHGARGFGYACYRHRPESDCPPGCEHEGHKVCWVADCPHDGISIVPSEAALIRQAATDFLAGESLTGIARQWNELGVPTPQRRRPWNGTIVRALLVGPRIAGLRAHRGEVVGPGAWEPIIDRATHEAIKRVLNDPGRRRKNPPRRQAFTGILRTPDGVPMVRSIIRGKYLTYQPQAGRGKITDGNYVTVSAPNVERYILELLFVAAEDGSLAKRRAASKRRRPVPVTEDPADIEAEMRQLAVDRGEGLISRAEWLAARRPLEDRLARAQAAAGGTEGSAGDVPTNLRDEWEGLSVDRQRAILGAVFERVIIHPAERKGGPGLDPRRIEPVWRD